MMINDLMNFPDKAKSNYFNYYIYYVHVLET